MNKEKLPWFLLFAGNCVVFGAYFTFLLTEVSMPIIVSSALCGLGLAFAGVMVNQKNNRVNNA